MRAKQLKGFPVIALNSGVALGRVQDLAVDPAQKKVVALIVGEKGLLKGRGRSIPFNHVYSIGRDAVTIEGEGEEERASEESTAYSPLRPFSFLGNSIISNSGDYIARVYDYTFSPETGEMESLLLHDFKERDKKSQNASLLVKGVHSLGRDYVIAVADYARYLAEAPAGQDEEESPTSTGEPEEEADMKGRAEEIAYDMRSRIGEFLNWAEGEISREGRGLARETRERVKVYLPGKTAGYTVKDSRGNFLIRGGEEITGEIVHAAETQDRLAPLFFSAFSGEVEDSFTDIANRIRRIFQG